MLFDLALQEIAGVGRCFFTPGAGLQRGYWGDQHFAGDLVALLDALEIPRAALVGHSMGVQVILDAWRQAAGCEGSRQR